MTRDECRVSSDKRKGDRGEDVKKKGTDPNSSTRFFSALRSALCLLGAMLLAASFPAAAQQLERKVPRIGYLDFRSTDLKAFRQGLHELGYEEGRNIAIEYRSAEEDLGRLAPLAA